MSITFKQGRKKIQTGRTLAMPEAFIVMKPIPLRDMIRQYLQWCVLVADGNQTVAASMADVSTRTIYTHVGSSAALLKKKAKKK